jgi:hypothetical protein
LKESRVLTYRQSKPGQLKCVLDLSLLYPSEDGRKRFRREFKKFVNLKSDRYNKEVYTLKDDQLIFFSEQLIPEKTDTRTSLLMVFGNPTSRSVREGMFFSFEGDHNEHRFWKHILPAEILNLKFDNALPSEERNKERKRRLLDLNYDPPFRLGLCVFLTLPSEASGSCWSGVAGIKRLLGTKAIKTVFDDERDRIVKIAEDFLAAGGAVLTFQKDAWESLRSLDDQEYALKYAKRGELRGTLIGSRNIPLYGLPPTRLTGPCQKVLAQVATEIISLVS